MTLPAQGRGAVEEVVFVSFSDAARPALQLRGQAAELRWEPESRFSAVRLARQAGTGPASAFAKS